jgi:hypothetical protein
MVKMNTTEDGKRKSKSPERFSSLWTFASLV